MKNLPALLVNGNNVKVEVPDNKKIPAILQTPKEYENSKLQDTVKQNILIGTL